MQNNHAGDIPAYLARKEVARQVQVPGQRRDLGHYDDPELAAWVADFARYMCFGLKPAMWHPRVGRTKLPTDRQIRSHKAVRDSHG